MLVSASPIDMGSAVLLQCVCKANWLSILQVLGLMSVNKHDVVRIVKAGVSDKAHKNALLALAGEKPGLWDGLDEEDVLGVLEQAIIQTGNAGDASSISISFIDDASPTILPAHGITNPCSMCAASGSPSTCICQQGWLLELVQQQFALQPTTGHTC